MQTDVVTGAFGYSGAAIARELLAAGHRVRTLTGHPGHPGRAPAGTEIDVRPLARTPCTAPTGFAFLMAARRTKWPSRT
jgi:nucleoside-diphosphate-sugar epimerase